MNQITVTLSVSLDASKLPALLALLAGSEPQVAIAAPAAEPKKRTKKTDEPAPAVETGEVVDNDPLGLGVTLSPAKNEAPPIPTIDQLKQAAIAAHPVLGDEKLAALVKKFGGTRLTEVPEAKRMDLLKALLAAKA